MREQRYHSERWASLCCLPGSNVAVSDSLMYLLLFTMSGTSAPQLCCRATEHAELHLCPAFLVPTRTYYKDKRLVSSWSSLTSMFWKLGCRAPETCSYAVVQHSQGKSSWLQGPPDIALSERGIQTRALALQFPAPENRRIRTRLRHQSLSTS